MKGKAPSGRVKALAVPVAFAVVLVVGVLYLTGAFHPHDTAAPPAAPTTTDPVESIAPGPAHVDQGDHPSTSPTTEPAKPKPFPQPFARVNPADPIDVLDAALTTIFSYKPGKDSSQMDAAERAKPLLGQAGVDVGFAALAPITGSQWDAWTARHLTVSATPTIPTRGDNPDNDRTVSRIATVTQRVTDSVGKPAGRPPQPLTVFVTAAKDATGAWHLDRIAVQS